jgi:signal transduction histidine kinase
MTTDKKTIDEIAHQMRSTLTPILGFAELIKRKLAKPDFIHEKDFMVDRLTRIEEQAKQMLNLINKLSE